MLTGSVAVLQTLTPYPQLYYLVQRFAAGADNVLTVKKPLKPSPLTAVEQEHLQLLRGTPEFADLRIPEGAVVRYLQCARYNIQYRGAKRGDPNERDCRVAYDWHRGRQLVRIYGQIRHFLVAKLCSAQGGDLRHVYLAYVDWFRMEIGANDMHYVWKDELVESRDFNHYVPIGQIVCKVALLPLTSAGRKCSVLELL